MKYEFDPHLLHEVAVESLSHRLEDGERFDALIERLAEIHPKLITSEPRRWVMSRAGGVLGKVAFLYMGPFEYVLIFGSPAATDGYTGRYNHMDCYKVILAGRYTTYDLETDQIEPTVLHPGDLSHMRRGEARGVQIDAGSWHLEYGRGLTATAMPFAMMDTLIVSMAVKPAIATAKEYFRFTRHARRG